MSKVLYAPDSVQAVRLFICLAGGCEDDKWRSTGQKKHRILKTDGLQLEG